MTVAKSQTLYVFTFLFFWGWGGSLFSDTPKIDLKKKTQHAVRLHCCLKVCGIFLKYIYLRTNFTLYSQCTHTKKRVTPFVSTVWFM